MTTSSKETSVIQNPSLEKTHFIGIGGIGMSGLARILLHQKYHVSGSDVASTPITNALIHEGACIQQGHSASYISAESTVIYSSDIKTDNPEYQAALNLKCPLLHRSDLLAQLLHAKKGIAITGTHGKTTTTALLTSVLLEAGLDPSFAAGGIIPDQNTNAKLGQGEYFIAEADESDGSFLKYFPFGAIVTNVDADHLDYFKNEEFLINSFLKFMSQVSSTQHLFFCGDDPSLNKYFGRGINYGFSPHCQLRIDQFIQTGFHIKFDIHFQGRIYKNIIVNLLGRHNALNAAAVFGLAINLGISDEFIRKAFKNFGGVKRRCEKKGEFSGVLFFDDYAHHPTELKTTIEGIRHAYPNHRLIAIYQPHRYSRFRDCSGLYKDVFNDVDQVMITDIYAAGETPLPGLTSQTLVNEIEANGLVPCQHIPRNCLAEVIADQLLPHDLVLTLGAGDITKVSDEIISFLHQKGITKLKVGVIVGGCSCEHEVALNSAEYILKCLNPEYYEIQYFGINKQGVWIGDNKRSKKNALEQLQDQAKENEKLIAKEERFINSKDSKEKTEKVHSLPLRTPEINSAILEKLMECDILFPILHGTYGEDGTIQGFFEMLGKAYVGCDYRSSAICMDKALTKRLMLLHGIPTSPFIAMTKSQWRSNQNKYLHKISDKIGFPCFVKPCHLGSSIGVYKATNETELEIALSKAFQVDLLVLVEKGLHAREIEFSVLGGDRVEVFPPGEILTGGAVYDYAAKYSSDSFPTSIQANLSPELISEGMRLAEMAYKVTGCDGMARVDFFLDKQNKFWLNEINPIPGFTQNSLFPKMCAANGLNGKLLVDKLIMIGRRRKIDKDRLLQLPK